MTDASSGTPKAKKTARPPSEESTSNSSEQPWWYAMSDDSDGPNPAEVGTAAQEAVKLAGAVAQWAEQTGLAEALKGIAEQAADSVRAAARSASSATGDADVKEAGQEQAHSAATCENCPICQGLDMVKMMSPEAAAGLTDALAAVTSVVRQAVDGFGGSSADPKSRVEHIDID